MPPLKGGGNDPNSEFRGVTFNVPPYKFEAGTPHLSGVIGLGAALDWINSVGLDKIAEHEEALIKYASESFLK